MTTVKAKGLSVATVFALAFTGYAGAGYAQTVETRYTRVSPADCQLVETGEPQGEDWLIYRCAGIGGVPVWLLYTDGTRLQVTFGPREFRRFIPSSADRDPSWPVEWRTRAGEATPYAAILRTRPAPGEDVRGTRLSVFHIWRDRPSCFLGYASTNQEAQAMADRPPQPGWCD